MFCYALEKLVVGKSGVKSIAVLEPSFEQIN